MLDYRQRHRLQPNPHAERLQHRAEQGRVPHHCSDPPGYAAVTVRKLAGYAILVLLALVSIFGLFLDLGPEKAATATLVVVLTFGVLWFAFWLIDA